MLAGDTCDGKGKTDRGTRVTGREGWMGDMCDGKGKMDGGHV